MTSLPLFDPPSAHFAPSNEDRKHAEQSEKGSENILDLAAYSDIRRLVSHKAGLLRELRDGQPTGREFYLAELHDGSIVNVYTTGEREPATPAMSAVLIDDAIRYGYFVEVAR